MIWNRPTGRLARAAVTLLTCAVVLAACGREAAEAPTPLPATSAAPILDLTPEATATESAVDAVASPSPVTSPVAGDPTVGELADRIAAAWSGVTSYRTTFTTFEMAPIASPVLGGSASPVAGGAERIVVEDVVLPDQRRRVETVGGRIVSEIVLADGAVYVRGIASTGTPTAMGAFVEIDPAIWPADSVYRAIYDGITTPIVPPYSALSDDERNRIAHLVGETSVGGRTCTAYRVADTSNIGERLDVVISLDEDDLLCSIETRASGLGTTIGTTVFEFNLPFKITAPENVLTIIV